MMRVSILVSILLACASIVPAEPLGIQSVHGGLSATIFLTHSGDGSNRLFLVGQAGVIRISKFGTLLPQPFLDISAAVTSPGETGGGSETGLLGLAFDPDYEENGRFYVNYTTRIGSQLTTRVSRFRADPPGSDQADGESEQTIIEFAQPQTNHNGGWIGFGPDELLYIAAGDGGGGGDAGGGHELGGNGQALNTVLGKMLRLDVSGDGTGYAIPETNPFFGETGPRGEIWAYGLRNPWRNSFDRLTGDLYIADVGQGDVEEVNFAPDGVGGQNYGWRVMEGDTCFDDEPDGENPPCFDASFTNPIHTYEHGETFRCSVTGGYVYRGERMPGSQGTYFFGDYCSHNVYALRHNNGSNVQVVDRSDELNPGSNISSFGEDEAGELYIVTPGEVFRIIDLGIHRADTDFDTTLSLSEVLRVVQLFNALHYSCASSGTEDEYQPGPGTLNCQRHSADYQDPQGVIDLSELLRVIQLYNVGGYTSCQGDSEDDFCVVI